MEAEQYKNKIRELVSEMEAEQVVNMVEGYGLMFVVKASTRVCTKYDPTILDIAMASSSRASRRKIGRVLFSQSVEETIGRSGPDQIKKTIAWLLDTDLGKPAEEDMADDDMDGSCATCEEGVRNTCLAISDADHRTLDRIEHISMSFVNIASKITGQKVRELASEGGRAIDAIAELAYYYGYERCAKNDLFSKVDSQEEDTLVDELLSRLRIEPSD